MSRKKNGQFAQGNPGRKPGSKNRVGAEIRTKLEAVVNGRLDDIETYLDQLFKTNPEKGLDALIKILPYCIPRLQSVELEDNTTNEKQEENDFSNLTADEQYQLFLLLDKARKVDRE